MQIEDHGPLRLSLGAIEFSMNRSARSDADVWLVEGYELAHLAEVIDHHKDSVLSRINLTCHRVHVYSSELRAATARHAIYVDIASALPAVFIFMLPDAAGFDRSKHDTEFAVSAWVSIIRLNQAGVLSPAATLKVKLKRQVAPATIKLGRG